MRYPASEKLEIIRLVEESALSVRWTPEKIEHSARHLLPPVRSVPGPVGSPGRPTSQTRSRLEPHSRRCSRARIIKLAMEEPALSPGELAVRFTDTEGILSQRLRSIGCSRSTI